MKLNLRIKDKIFIFIVGAGLILVLINGLYPKSEEEKVINKTEEKKEVSNELNQEKEKTSSQAKVSLGNKELEVIVARTELERYQGLSGKNELEEGKGMLFLFDDYDNHGFVMREMNFDLDFIFIHDEEVVDYKKNIQKDFSGKIFGSKKYNKVIEVRKGWVEDEGLLIGDKVEVIYF